jgi:GT2 family glycosyltransferase
MENSVTIAVPTYFAGVMLHNCIESILQHVNAPKITIYKNTDGWLQACNKLISETTDDIILLNDDTIVLTDIVREMQSVAYSDPKIGIVGGKSLSPNQETVINYGIYVGKDGNTAHKHYGEHKSKVYKTEVQKAVEGSCIFIKREVINTVGMFDEGYGMGFREEVDFCFRAREAGYKVVSCPTAEYVHLVSQTHQRLNITNSTHEYFMSKWATKLALGKV